MQTLGIGGWCGPNKQSHAYLPTILCYATEPFNFTLLPLPPAPPPFPALYYHSEPVTQLRYPSSGLSHLFPHVPSKPSFAALSHGPSRYIISMSPGLLLGGARTHTSASRRMHAQTDRLSLVLCTAFKTELGWKLICHNWHHLHDWFCIFRKS